MIKMRKINTLNDLLLRIIEWLSKEIKSSDNHSIIHTIAYKPI
jgi:hypothetical protein